MLADVHFQDIYGEFPDINYSGIKNPQTGKQVLIRTMAAQLHSTRIFNENYFAFIATLDDLIKRKVKYVLFPGDFSDDGQPVHIQGLKRVLDRYSKAHDIQFFMATGNHDPVKPFTHPSGKNDYLGEDGKAQPIMSTEGMYTINPKLEHPVVITNGIKKWGYQEITSRLGDFGFLPKEEYRYWETPFSTYNYESYNFEVAKKAGDFKNRNYTIVSNNFSVPDASYLVEPVEGLWIMAIDANVFIPLEDDFSKAKNADNFTKASNNGYNKVLSHKKYLVKWIEKVAKEAEKRNKTVIPFSHFPMIDFNDGANEAINSLLIGEKMQTKRVPNQNVAQVFADAGLKVHFGGHMHVNDTGIASTENGNTLVNIQVASSAAYIPSYKLVTLKENKVLEIQTEIIDSVPGFDKLFPLYEQEHQFLEDIGKQNIWDKEILSSKTYLEFINWHLKELTRLRFIPNDWPSETADFLQKLSGEKLLILSYLETSLSYKEILKKLENNSLAFEKSWIQATQKAKKEATASRLDFETFKIWTGFDLIYDLYRLRGADKLALSDIGLQRIKHYNLMMNRFLKSEKQSSEKDVIKKHIYELFSILHDFLNGEPANHFKLNLKTGEIQNL